MADRVKWYKIFGSETAAKARVPEGRLQLIKIGHHKICLAHTLHGFFAVSDTCTHLQASLSQGHTNYLNQIICPWHSYRFDLKNGSECQNRASDLPTFPVEIRADGLYIGIRILE